MSWPCETRTSTCRSFATISSGLYRFLAITVLLDVKDIPQVGPLQWGRISLAPGCPRTDFCSQEGPANPSGRPKQRHRPNVRFHSQKPSSFVFRLQMQLLHKKSLICTKTLGSIGAMTSASQRSGLEFRFERGVSLGLKSFIARLDELRTGVAL